MPRHNLNQLLIKEQGITPEGVAAIESLHDAREAIFDRAKTGEDIIKLLVELAMVEFKRKAYLEIPYSTFAFPNRLGIVGRELYRRCEARIWMGKTNYWRTNMKIIDTKFKVRTINKDGRKKFVPIQKTTFLGFGWWVDCPEWMKRERNIAVEKSLGMDSDSTLTHIRAFIDTNDPNPRNEYYNE